MFSLQMYNFYYNLHTLKTFLGIVCIAEAVSRSSIIFTQQCLPCDVLNVILSLTCIPPSILRPAIVTRYSRFGVSWCRVWSLHLLDTFTVVTWVNGKPRMTVVSASSSLATAPATRHENVALVALMWRKRRLNCNIRRVASAERQNIQHFKIHSAWLSLRIIFQRQLSTPV